MRHLELFGLAVLSAAGLVLELSFTRVLSVLYFYPYVYIVLSVAVLGIGLGAALAAWQPHFRQPTYLSLWALLAAVSALLITILAVAASRLELLIPLLVAAALPYLFIGLALATVFARHREKSSLLYWADLAGSGLGALLAIPILNAVGGLNGMLTAALLLVLAGLCFAAKRAFGFYFCLLVACVLVGNLAWNWLPLDMASLDKTISLPLQHGGKVVKTRWDAFARTDLVYLPSQQAYRIYLDGAAGSVAPDISRLGLLERDIGSMAFAGQPKSAFIIGPGGGLDVALARAAEVTDITAVELDAASVDFVRSLGDYTGGVYNPRHTHVLIDEGRSALRRTNQRFDVILLSQVVTEAAEARGYALTENTVYTTEAFHDYLDHLNPGGQIALKLYDNLTLTRAFTTAIQALENEGLSASEAAQHLVALLDPQADRPIPLLLVRKRALSPQKAAAIAQRARERGFAVLFDPGVVAQPPLSGLLAGRTTLAEIIGASKADIRPTTDAWPFFFQFQRGLPNQLKPLLYGFAALLLLGALLFGAKQPKQSWLRWSPALFAALGFGFMVTEICLLERSKLFLGYPTLTLSTVLGTLLLGAGLGSQLSGRTAPGREFRVIFTSGLLVALTLTVWMLVWPPLTEALRGEVVTVRVVVTVLTTLPSAFFMGMPFPLALRSVGRFGARHIALSWAVSGVLSVAGSLGATTLALLFGFNSVAVAAVASYLLVAALAFTWRRKERRAPQAYADAEKLPAP